MELLIGFVVDHVSFTVLDYVLGHIDAGFQLDMLFIPCVTYLHPYHYKRLGAGHDRTRMFGLSAEAVLAELFQRTVGELRSAQ